MQKLLFLFAITIPWVLAFPNFDKDSALEEHIERARGVLSRRKLSPKQISKNRTNCGPTPCTTFDLNDQYVSVTGSHIWVRPGPNNIRGPCPGLNVAANHGYIPRSGMLNLQQAITGLTNLFNMSPQLAAGLAAYAIAVDGNVAQGVWTIGGPLPPNLQAGDGTGQGLSYSHNNNEADASLTRDDAYLNNGDAHSLDIDKFAAAYAVGGKEDRYTLDKFVSLYQKAQEKSIASNPYYFTGVISTLAFVPASYNFVINFMSNHSVEEPSGYLDGAMFKSFFAVTGQPGKHGAVGSLQWQRGQERIPSHWFRRPSSNQYAGHDMFEDLAIGYAAYPNTLKFGGNTGGTSDSYVAVPPENITTGHCYAADLMQIEQLACCSYNLLYEGVPKLTSISDSNIQQVLAFIRNYTQPALTAESSCYPPVYYNFSAFNQFPGYHYLPSGNDTNY